MEQEVDKESSDLSPEKGPDSENTEQGGFTTAQAQSSHASGGNYSSSDSSESSDMDEELEPTDSLLITKDHLDAVRTDILLSVDSLVTKVGQVSAMITDVQNLSIAVSTLSKTVASIETKCESLFGFMLEIRDHNNNTERKMDVISSEISQLRIATNALEQSVDQQKQDTSASVVALQQTVEDTSVDVKNALHEFGGTLDEQVTSLRSLTETYTACAELISKLDSKIVNGVNEWLAVSTTAVSDTFVLSSLISDVGPVLNDLRNLKTVVDTLILSSLNIEKVFKEWNVYGGSVSAMLSAMSADIRDMKDTKLLLEKISTVTSLIESLSNTVVNAVSIKKKIVV